jgi:glycerate 2-kinase
MSTTFRTTALLIANSAYKGADPKLKVLESLTKTPFSKLLASYPNHLVFAIGKAAGRMTEGYLKYIEECGREKHVDNILNSVNEVHTQTTILDTIRIRLVTNHGGYIPKTTLSSTITHFNATTASHPTPDKAGEEAAKDILNLSSTATKNTLCLVLLSGGGSALLPSPPLPLCLDDIVSLNTILLSCGASIDEINCLRKHTSSISGGRLVSKLCESGAGTVLTLALSDVVGDRPDVIASGLMSADPSTFHDAFEIISRYKLEEKLSTRILDHIKNGMNGLINESVKKIPSNSEYNIIASNSSALEEVAKVLWQNEKIKSYISTSTLQGESVDVGKVLASLLHRQLVRENDSDISRPLALLFGGETTVTLGTKHGIGGRAQELALSVAVTLEDLLGPSSHHSFKWECIAFGTDGQDGPSSAAGAFVNERTISAGLKKGLQAKKFLREHDSYTYFSSLCDTGNDGGLIITGPSGTNVSDVYILIAR